MSHVDWPAIQARRHQIAAEAKRLLHVQQAREAMERARHEHFQNILHGPGRRPGSPQHAAEMMQKTPTDAEKATRYFREANPAGTSAEGHKFKAFVAAAKGGAAHMMSAIHRHEHQTVNEGVVVRVRGADHGGTEIVNGITYEHVADPGQISQAVGIVRQATTAVEAVSTAVTRGPDGRPVVQPNTANRLTTDSKTVAPSKGRTGSPEGVDPNGDLEGVEVEHNQETDPDIAKWEAEYAQYAAEHGQGAPQTPEADARVKAHRGVHSGMGM